MIDSHCHLDRLDLSNYENKFEFAIKHANSVGVTHFLCPAVDLENFPKILQIGNENESVFIAVGSHPSEELNREITVNELCELADNPKVVAIGETGLDYHYCENTKSAKEWQRRRFITHVHAANELKKPLIIHSREASTDIIQILKTEKSKDIGGVLHCFTEDLETAIAAIELNFYIGFSGIITFKSAEKIRSIAKQIPIDKILIETDSPYLAPVPHRGKPNSPAYLPLIAECLANLRNLTTKDIASQTTNNFFQLFS
jgi:TatD DNase family protein